jgi:predicted methyltransferase
MTIRHAILAFAAMAIVAGVGARAQNVPDYAAIVAAPDRRDSDRDIDKRRDPVKLLAFTGARPGMTVLDMGAGGGYSTELMARAVAPNGKVYAQNMPNLFPKAKANFDARMQTPAMKSVTALFRPFDDPTPPEVRNIDLVTFFFFYHDVTYMEVDRAAMNKKLFSALKPGGVLVIADPASARLCIASRRRRCGARSRRRDSSWSARRISCASQATRATSRRHGVPGRSTSSS